MQRGPAQPNRSRARSASGSLTGTGCHLSGGSSRLCSAGYVCVSRSVWFFYGVSMRRPHLRACALPGWPTHILVIGSSVGHRRTREPMLPPLRRTSEARAINRPDAACLSRRGVASHRLTGQHHVPLLSRPLDCITLFVIPGLTSKPKSTGYSSPAARRASRTRSTAWSWSKASSSLSTA
jgi:hypothetical protein